MVRRRAGRRCRCSTPTTRCGSARCSAPRTIRESLISRQIAYWATQLAGLPDQLDLPADRPRPAVASGRVPRSSSRSTADLHAGARRSWRARTTRRCSWWCMRRWRCCWRGCRAPTTSRSAPRSRVVASVSSTIWSACSSTPWCCAPTSIGGESFTDLLARVRETDLAAFGHADVPFERLVEVLNPARSQARHPLFQVALAFQNLGTDAVRVAGLDGGRSGRRCRYREVRSAGHVRRAAGDRRRSLAGRVDSMPRICSTSRRWSCSRERLVRVLEAIVADPAVPVGDIEILDAAEQCRCVCGAAAPAGDACAASVAGPVRRAAARCAGCGGGAVRGRVAVLRRVRCAGRIAWRAG